ncbi:MAG: S9 family peptidase [Phycisphaeraceae bacterium]|nr:MAG: S9 family peptidase [Phycisphaeraceae bacterium]
MNLRPSIAASLSLAFTLSAATVPVSAQNGQAPAGPPATETRPVTDNYFGETFVDPYRWLEGDNADPEHMGKMTDEVAAWTDKQNAYTRSILDGDAPGFEFLKPIRARLEAQIQPLMEIGEISLPHMAGNRYFYSKRTGAQDQAIVYVREGAAGAPRKLIDPFELDDEGLVTVAWYAPNDDGSLLAFGTYRAGDENSVLHILDVDTGEWLADEIPGKTYIAGWMPDGESFFYQRLEDLGDPYSTQVRYHKIGRHWTQDPILIRQREAEKLYEGLNVSDDRMAKLKTTWGPEFNPDRDGHWAVVSYWTSTSANDVWVMNLDEWFRTGKMTLTPILIGEDGRNDATVAGNAIYMQTYVNAPNGRIVKVNPHSPARDAWVDVVPHRADAILEGFSIARGVLCASYLFDASTRIELFGLDGAQLGALTLPGTGSASLSTERDRTEAYLAYSSFNEPETIYHVDLATPDAAPSVWEKLDVPIDPDSVVVKRVKYSSKDGTEVGMFIIHKRGLKLDGNNPTILYGYGGFDISMTPRFTATNFPFFDAGGVYAVANLRGGGEKGLEWHRAGMLDRKQNVFDDFISAAEWLIQNGYTSPERLGVLGGSNGGLLTGAMVTERPDLIAAAVVAVPLLDMLRFEKFLMARYWVPEYGSAENQDQYKYLRAYSPYQNIKPGTRYPAVLLTAGENDSRVHPMHARKMAAYLQAATTSEQTTDPILVWVDRDAGHGQGKPLHLRVRDAVDIRLFLMWQTGMFDQG